MGSDLGMQSDLAMGSDVGMGSDLGMGPVRGRAGDSDVQAFFGCERNTKCTQVKTLVLDRFGIRVRADVRWAQFGLLIIEGTAETGGQLYEFTA